MGALGYKTEIPQAIKNNMCDLETSVWLAVYNIEQSKRLWFFYNFVQFQKMIVYPTMLVHVAEENNEWNLSFYVGCPTDISHTVFNSSIEYQFGGHKEYDYDSAWNKTQDTNECTIDFQKIMTHEKFNTFLCKVKFKVGSQPKS